MTDRDFYRTVPAVFFRTFFSMRTEASFSEKFDQDPLRLRFFRWATSPLALTIPIWILYFLFSPSLFPALWTPVGTVGEFFRERAVQWPWIFILGDSSWSSFFLGLAVGALLRAILPWTGISLILGSFWVLGGVASLPVAVALFMGDVAMGLLFPLFFFRKRTWGQWLWLHLALYLGLSLLVTLFFSPLHELLFGLNEYTPVLRFQQYLGFVYFMVVMWWAMSSAVFHFVSMWISRPSSGV